MDLYYRAVRRDANDNLAAETAFGLFKNEAVGARPAPWQCRSC